MSTFVITAMEAKEFPKFIPMTVCDGGISIGACALPFGIERPFNCIFIWGGLLVVWGKGMRVCGFGFICLPRLQEAGRRVQRKSISHRRRMPSGALMMI